ncbi:hypothetical protein [Hydrocarboniphaga sp.]|uniref:hypothetical protein n=1 Tax=Hydrocarboniphaga sp. TaxID=2033016 RepID=UPI00263544CF|nr:hypothetical protein [Hydrocarboniphaga sp.]
MNDAQQHAAAEVSAFAALPLRRVRVLSWALRLVPKLSSPSREPLFLNYGAIQSNNPDGKAMAQQRRATALFRAEQADTLKLAGTRIFVREACDRMVHAYRTQVAPRAIADV